MKRMILMIAALLACLAVRAQMSPEDFYRNYSRQVAAVGADGVGVETIVARWENAYPDDGHMLEAKFLLYLNKSRTTQVVQMDRKKYLGAKPSLVLKDTAGRNVNYFEVTMYEDELFGIANQAVDKAVKLYPDSLIFRLEKLSAMIDYEKESPDMAGMELDSMIDAYLSSDGRWRIDGATVEDSLFVAVVQDYCNILYRVASPTSYGIFKSVSERMNKLFPKRTEFIDNIGTYWLVAEKDSKQALKWYKKALKINSEDEVAQKNMRIATAMLKKPKN